MHIAGIQKISLIDYPGMLSAVLFFTGCNFHCPYCHNPDLARGRLPADGGFSRERVLTFLRQRAGFLDAVVISGGEPTLTPDLDSLCSAVKDLGYLVKLDTNGSRPAVLERLLAAGLIDYVAMDLKTPPESYPPHISAAPCAAALDRSIALLRGARVGYEIRTTCTPFFVDAARIADMARRVAGAPLYALQAFESGTILNPAFFDGGPPPFGPEEMAALQAAAAPYVARCIVR